MQSRQTYSLSKSSISHDQAFIFVHIPDILRLHEKLQVGDGGEDGRTYLFNILLENAMEAELAVRHRRWMSEHSVFSHHQQVRDL